MLETFVIVLPALLAGLIITAVHAPLGIEVLRRGIIFIDLAIAQIAGLCVVMVRLWMHDPSWLTTQLVAVLSALAAAVFFRWVEKILPQEQEAIIGCCFILSASGTLLALANHPHGGEEVQNILSGQMLFITWSEVAAFLPLYATVAILWQIMPAVKAGIGFFVLFALVVTASVQLVGVYLVFASLILPALAVNHLQKSSTCAAVACGTTAVIIGIFVSTLGDLPAGPVLIFIYAVVAISFRLIYRDRKHRA